MRHRFIATALFATIFSLSAVLSLLTPTIAAADGAYGDDEEASDQRRTTQDRQMRLTPSQHINRHPFVDHRGFFRIAPSIGSFGIFGDVSANSQMADVSSSAIDNLENIDLVTGLAVEAGYRRVGVGVDLLYFDMSTRQADVNGQSQFDLQKFMTDFTVNWTYNPLDNLELGPRAGFRHIYLNTTLSADEDDTELMAAESAGWLDPILGIHGRYTFADHFLVSYFGDVGGLGFGSEITWQLYASIGATTNSIDFELGYRHLFMDFESDDLDYEMNVGGPIFTTRFRF